MRHRQVSAIGTAMCAVLSLPAAGASALAQAPAPSGSAATSAPAPSSSAAWGRVFLNSRLRYEHADQVGLEASNASTLRVRIGYETPRLHGFHGLVELERNWVLNAAGSSSFPPPFHDGRTAIPDPESATLNRMYGAWSRERAEVVVGRQTIELDNQRLVGPVGWRQVNQTLDAARLVVSPASHVEVTYAYIDRVNRVFGSKAPTAELRRFSSDSHLLHLRYGGWPAGELSAVLLDLHLEGAPGMSSTTIGTAFARAFSPGDGWSIRLEYAQQRDNRASGGTGFVLHYGHGRIAYRRGGMTLGGGIEELGGNGARGFQTPLATLHTFNGWADTFLTTPPRGLRDAYLFGEGWIEPLGAVTFGEAHLFSASRDGERYGREVGVGLRKSLHSRVTGVLKMSRYVGAVAPASATWGPDRFKAWMQMDVSL